MPRLPRPLRAKPARWTHVALAGLMLVACRDVQQQSATAGPNDIGGTMVVAQPGEPATLLPALQGQIIERQITDLLYDRLAEIGEDLNTVGDKGFRKQLADRWEWAADSLSIVFHLNPRARWHDGQPVRASDVRYSVALMKDPALGSPGLPLIGNIDSVAVRDSLTAVAYFKRHTPEQFYDLVYQVSIVPQHILGNTPAGQMKTAEITRRGIGSGRFRLARFEPGKRLELVADTANYRGRPKLDRIVYVPTPDFNTAVTRFFAGDADFFEQLRPEHLAKIATDTARRAVPYTTLGYAYLALNNVDAKQPGLPHPIFGDRAVRRALTMAVDRRAMLRNVFGTYGAPAYGPFPRSLPAADTTLPQLPYDTTRARALLDSAGWLVGPDGVRAKDGRRLEFGITTPVSSAARKQYSVLLQDAFKQIGAVARIDEVDMAGFMARNGDRSFDTILELYATDPSVSGFKQSWTTSGIGKDGSNFGSYSNPAVDALLDSATLTFEPARTRVYARRAFETIIEDAPGIWLYEPPSVAGLHKRIRTTPMRADGYWSGMADWWIPAAERTARDRIGLRPTP
ncbi:MAG TPA: peptide ABC transporter substrate-binding protein [Gemmatimonadaceae bacterium]|nr:peptide ABC transporter substrate-binding protein [Gemmatimonadaceae bacterium]